jgi:hypothetical protein
MEDTPENGKELSHSARANGMNEWCKWLYHLLTMLHGSDSLQIIYPE